MVLHQKDLVAYESVNKSVARAAQKRFAYHLWYLSEGQISFAVFDDGLRSDDKDKLVEGILHREGIDDSKKRSLDLKDIPDINLWQLSTKNSIKFF